MSSMNYSKITDPAEIDVLRGKESAFANFRYRYDEETLALLKKNIERRDSLYLLAKNGEEFAAFCSIDSDWWEPNYFFLREIFVMPGFQGQSIGETLMRKCIEHAKSNNALGVVTETAFENIPMQKLCEKLGFKKWENPQWKEGITYRLMF